LENDFKLSFEKVKYFDFYFKSLFILFFLNI
jgi:hypothetical protein